MKTSSFRITYVDVFFLALNAIHNWVKLDLSAFYVELIKDRLYLDEARSLSRRSVQTVMLHIYDHLLGMLAPITPLLVEEAWSHTPEAIKRDATHPLQRLYPTAPSEWKKESLEGDLPLLLAAKDAVNVAQEQARAAKQVGSSLQSAIVLSFPPSEVKLHRLFQSYEDELEALFVVSSVKLVRGDAAAPDLGDFNREFSGAFETGNGSQAMAYAFAHDQGKCARCWRYAASTDVKPDQALCARCETVVNTQPNA